MSAPLCCKNLPENPTSDDILNNPTGSGKSLVALALQFKFLRQGRRSPIFSDHC